MVKSQQKKKKTRKGGTAPPKKSGGPKRQPAKTIIRGPAIGNAERLCAKHYAETVMNPFDTPSGACVPMLPCLDSAKRKIFARGTGQTSSSNGFGGVNCSTSLCHDLITVKYTLGNAGTCISDSNTSDAYNNSELAYQDFQGQSVQARVVGCGLRVRFTGKQVDMNGTVYALEEPSHLTTDNLTVPDLLKFDKVKTKPFNRNWVVASWQPVLPAETAYSMNGYASPFIPLGGEGGGATAPLVILIQCQSGESLPFEWEWFCHYEAIGTAARGKSASHLAPTTGPMVTAALQRAPSVLFDDVSNRKVNMNTISNKMIEHGSSWQFAGDLARRVAGTAVGAITSRAAQQYMSGGLMALAL